jgi:hypothetical protein
MNYTPIDYRTWDFSGKGLNIKDLMNDVHSRLWQEALPFQDVRNDTGHAESVTFFGYKLQSLVGGDLEIIVPDCFFHDSQWDIKGEEYHRLVAAGIANDPILRFNHQARGALKAVTELKKIGLPKDKLLAVYSHLVDHDTRYRRPADLNEMIFRDADILWRFTEPVRRNYFPKLSVVDFVRRIEQDELSNPERFYLKESRPIARIELINAALFTDMSSADQLKGDYPEEVKKILEMYSKAP